MVKTPTAGMECESGSAETAGGSGVAGKTGSVDLFGQRSTELDRNRVLILAGGPAAGAGLPSAADPTGRGTQRTGSLASVSREQALSVFPRRGWATGHRRAIAGAWPKEDQGCIWLPRG